MSKSMSRSKPGPSEEFTLHVPRFVTMPLVHHLIDRAQPLIERGRQFRRLNVDASELTLISPVGLATLASVLLGAARDKRFEEGVIVFPKKKHVRTYLSRMNFNRLLRVKGARLDRPHRSPRSGRFRELVEVETEDECIRLTAQMLTVLKKKALLSDAVLDNVAYCLSEVLENVIQHAESPTNGVACAQAYPESKAVELAIVDCGIGVQSSLKKNPEYTERIRSDEEAVQLALQKGVTSNPGRNTGEGLFFVAELLGRSGKMRFQSGEAVLSVGRGGMLVKRTPQWPGTLVGLRFELRKGIPIREIFDKHTVYDEELGLFRLIQERPAGGA